MRILLLSYYFPPTGGPGAVRWARLLEHFPKHYQVDIISVDNVNHPVLDEKLLDRIPDRFNIYRSKSPERFLRKGKGSYLRIGKSHNLFLPDSKFWWIGRASRIAKENGDYDIIIATAPPFSALVAASKVALKFDIPFIADMRDSYLLDPNPPKPGNFFSKQKERIFYKYIQKASAIIAVNPMVQKEMRFRIRFKKPTFFIPNGIVPIDEPKSPAKMTIAMAGRFFGNLNFPENLFHALGLLKDSGRDFSMRFLGPADQRLYDYIEKLGLEDYIEITGSLTHDEIIQELSGASVLFTYLDDRPGNSRQIQSKIWDYLGIGKPIVAVVPKLSPGAEIIRKYNAGIVAKDSPDDIAAAIEKSHGKIPQIPQDISWRDRAKQYCEIIEKLIISFEEN